MTYTDFLGFMSGITGTIYVLWTTYPLEYKVVWGIGFVYVWLTFTAFLTMGLYMLGGNYASN
jgi:hypothetical protein